MTELPPRLWTAWCDYLATGEGQTLMARVGCARDEEQCRRQFAEAFDEFFARGCHVAPGVIRNSVTEMLWPISTLDYMERCDKAGMVVAEAKLHFNFS